MTTYDLICANCGASASLPLGVICEGHDPKPVLMGSRKEGHGRAVELERASRPGPQRPAT